MTEPEEALPGGNLGGAVRVGDTVRKPSGPWTPAIHALLVHPEAVGFVGAPRSLGLDERGRHMLSFLEGETVGDGERVPWPAWCCTDETLVEVARWLRAYHDAVASFVPPADAAWRFVADDGPGSLVLHNDVGAYNAVWRDGLVGFVDWDTAGPGEPWMDVAQVCLDFAPLLSEASAGPLGADHAQQLRRARLVLDTYGVQDRTPFPDLIVERFRTKVARIRGMAVHDPVFAWLWAENEAFLVPTLAHVRAIRDDLATAFA